MNNAADQNNKLGALWEKISPRGTYMTGKIDPSKWEDEALQAVLDALSARQPVPLVVFRRDTSNDPEGSRRPDWDILRPRKKGAAVQDHSYARTETSAAPVAPITADDIPF